MTVPRYSNVLCGAIRGAMASLGIQVECSFDSDALADADNVTVLDLELLGVDADVFAA